MSRCTQCGELPIGPAGDETSVAVVAEIEFDVTAIHDNSRDFYLRLSRLITSMNVMQLRQREKIDGERRIVPLGMQTNSVAVADFMERAAASGLVVEVHPANEDGVQRAIKHGDSL